MGAPLLIHNYCVRNAIREQMDELRHLLNEWDFIRVRDLNVDDDEYDCLLGPLVSRLAKGADVDEVASYLRMRIEEHFGMDPNLTDINDFANTAVKWWRGRGSRAARETPTI